METTTVEDQALLAQQLAQARQTLDGLSGDLRAADAELASIATERKQHRLVLDACIKLEELHGIGGAELFWGNDSVAGVEQLRQVRSRTDVFQQHVDAMENRRQSIVEEVTRQQSYTDALEDGLFEALDEEEKRKQEWIIEREITQLPARSAVMPWTRGEEEDQRFRKSATTALLLSILFALIVPYIPLPSLRPDAATETANRVVQLLVKQRPKPPAPPREHKPERVAQQKPVQQPQPTAVPQQQTPAEEKPVETVDKGILALRDKFAELKDDQVVSRLGSQARINKGNGESGPTQRAMLTTNAPGSSGGINLASISRGVGGSGGGGGMARVQVTNVTSGIGGIGKPGADRPLSGDGVGASRTDEEIQIVFDRYKAALYRLYNKELRKDPALRGQMVLRLTIEPGGEVSFCKLESSDMNAPDLAAQVVDRVKTINFGAKDGVPAITILYPIDFLPAA